MTATAPHRLALRRVRVVSLLVLAFFAVPYAIAAYTSAIPQQTRIGTVGPWPSEVIADLLVVLLAVASWGWVARASVAGQAWRRLGVGVVLLFAAVVLGGTVIAPPLTS